MKSNEISVAMYCPFFLPAYGGAELATLNLAKELIRYCNVELFSFNSRASELNVSSKYLKQEIIDGIPINRYSIIYIPIINNFSLNVINDLISMDFDIIHFQGVSKLFSTMLTQKIVKNKLKILTTHGLQEALQIIRANKLGIFIFPFFINTLKSMDHIIALSKEDVKELIKLGINQNKITLIPNGIDVKKFQKRRQYTERNKKIKILCVARFDQNKGYETLVHSLKQLQKDFDLQAYFIGEVTNSKYLKKIMSLVKKLNLEKIVKFGLSLDDPALTDCYLTSDLFILPSEVETFALVILEAMYAGLPILATPVGCVPFLIKNGINGYIIPKNDPITLYKRCRHILNNKKMMKNMGNRNREIVRDYSWSKIASSTYNLYQQLIRARD